MKTMGLDDIREYIMKLQPELQDMNLWDRKVMIALAAAGVTSAYLIYLLTKNRYNLPPGPWPWPIVGNLFVLGGSRKLHDTCVDYAAKFGDIFTIHVGSEPVVVLNSPEAIREAFLDKGNDYADRTITNSTRLFVSEDAHSIVFSNATPVWKLQRKIAHAALRKFAGGIQLEQMLQKGSSDFIDLVMKEGSTPFDPQKYLALLVYSTIGTMVFGREFDLDDPWYVEFVYKEHEYDKIFTNILPSDVFPILGYLPNPSAGMAEEQYETFEKFLKEIVQEHRENYDPSDISDFVYFLMEAEEEAKKDPSEDKDAVRILTDDTFLGILKDIFFAGTGTSELTLQWLIGFCVQYQEVQAKIHQEIDDAIGLNGVIRLSDKNRLPYTAAVVFETIRLRPILPMALPHRTICDTMLRDYTLPKGTTVWPNLWALHMDPNLWKDPEKFDPERWLDEAGNKRRHPYQFLPFSTGRRVCVGEAVAKIELHLYAAMIFQKLEFRPPPGKEDSFWVENLPDPALNMAAPFEVITIPRS